MDVDDDDAFLYGDAPSPPKAVKSEAAPDFELVAVKTETNSKSWVISCSYNSRSLGSIFSMHHIDILQMQLQHLHSPPRLLL